MTKETNIHPFDAAIYLTKENEKYIGKTSDAYKNMIGPFGGVTAASLLKAIIDHPERKGEPISLTVNFAAAIKDGKFSIQPRLRRSTRTTQHWYVELKQKGSVSITATAVLARRKDTWSETEARMPEVPLAGELASIPVEGLPAWVGQYDMRIVKGIPDLANPKIVEDSTTLQWIKDVPDRPLDVFSLTSICDAFFPRIFVKRNEMGLIGTVSLTVHFHADLKTIGENGERHILAKAWANKFYNRFFDQTGEVWSEEGELLATTNQMVYFRR